VNDFDSKSEDGEFVVTNHKKRPGEELRLRFSDYSNGKKMLEAINAWAAAAK